VQYVKEARILKELLEIGRSNWPDRVKRYMTQSRQCYEVGAFDASIVMSSRAVEFAIKNLLGENQQAFDEKDTMGSLVDRIRSMIGKKKPTEQERIYEKLGDVVRLHRNITAHDNPMAATREDADLIWASAVYAVKKILES